MMSPAERQSQWAHAQRIAEDYNKKRDQVNDRYFEARDRRDEYIASDGHL